MAISALYLANAPQQARRCLCKDFELIVALRHTSVVYSAHTGKLNVCLAATHGQRAFWPVRLFSILHKLVPHLWLVLALAFGVSGCGLPSSDISPVTNGGLNSGGSPEPVEEVDEGPPGCTSNDDCIELLAPLAPCDNAICEVASGSCRRETKATGDACEDGNICTTNDTCFGGTCLGGAPLDCDDGLQCTDDSCDSIAGCSSVERDGACDDGDECTVDDTCDAGECIAGEPADCSDNNPCTIDGCDASTGCAWTVRLGESCDDDDACTTGDVCQMSSLCVASGVLVCDDDNACTSDSCDPFNGCINDFNSNACDDGQVCTVNDTCSEGACVGEVNACDDGNECSLDSCDPEAGCINQPHFGPCDDASLCTINDTCATGTCIGVPDDCDDGNSCTVDYCHPVDGCQHTVLGGASCEDGNPCTAFDACDDFGVCLPGDPTNCDDANECTHDVCSVDNGCVYTPTTSPCDDQNACSENDMCREGACEGDSILCEDGNDCTLDTCSFITGCVFIETDDLCEDGDACTTEDQCDAGKCVGLAVDCDDGQPCTTDTCFGDAECDHVIHVGPCEDGNPCTTGDVCVTGDCVPGVATDCDDGNACTLDACTYETGCVHVQAPSCVTPTGWLVINEFDYEQGGDDSVDFIELIAVGDQAVELSQYRVELVDGATGSPYATYFLASAVDQVHPGEMLILGPPNIVNALEGVAATLLTSGNFLQNGGQNGDAIRLVRAFGGSESVTDAVSYEAPVFLTNEGDSHVGFDSQFAVDAQSFLRCPDGTDTDDNALDFVIGPPSPGVANECEEE